MKQAQFFSLALAISSLCTGEVRAQTLYRLSGSTLFDGKFGPIAKIQTKANEALVRCGNPTVLTPDGKFGSGTQKALATLARCPEFTAKLLGDADARLGNVTITYWNALVGGAPPSLDARARTIMLTYEATDYTKLEWNFCQSRPLFDPAAGRTVCFSNDPRSYLTWGPNGATAGGGREVQLILEAINTAQPALIDLSFGSEASAVRRTFVLADRDLARSVETFLCGVWANPQRRASWKIGFEKLGSEPLTRDLFDNHYRSASLDGGKIATFIRAYRENGLTPTEVDYAYFKDRSAHTGPSLAPIKQAIASLLASTPNAPHWKVRQAISLAVRPGSQRTDRLGRDVAFYIDGGQANLSQEELSAWGTRGRIKASDAGLSDQQLAPAFVAGPVIATTIANPQSLSLSERAACPQAVLNTVRP